MPASPWRSAPMIDWSELLPALPTPAFRGLLKQAIERLPPSALPLQQAAARGSHAVDRAHTAMILAVTERPDAVCVKAGIFYASIIAGCNCADDPSPVEPLDEYCTLLFEIDRATGRTTVSLAAEAG